MFRELRLVSFSLLACLLGLGTWCFFFFFFGLLLYSHTQGSLEEVGLGFGISAAKEKRETNEDKLKLEESYDISWRVHVKLVSMYPCSYQQEHYCSRVKGAPSRDSLGGFCIASSAFRNLFGLLSCADAQCPFFLEADD